MDQASFIAAVEAAARDPDRLRKLLRESRPSSTTAEAVPALRDALMVDDRKVRQSVLLHLAPVRESAATEAITSVLDWSDSDTVAVAAHLLSLRKARETVPQLIDCLERRGARLQGKSRDSLLSVIAQLARPLSGPLLSPNLDTRWQDDPRLPEVLEASLFERDNRVRKASARAMRRIGKPESREALERAASQLSWWRGRYARSELRTMDAHGL